jgi:hypothetical protein
MYFDSSWHWKTDSQTVDIDELDFVAAVYDGKWYLGKVITIDDEENEAKFNFMEQCTGKIAGIYRWPNPPDKVIPIYPLNFVRGEGVMVPQV